VPVAAASGDPCSPDERFVLAPNYRLTGHPGGADIPFVKNNVGF
jgi:hypothetical protein